MVETDKKSTDDPAHCVIYPDVILDGRLAVFHRRESWLALADLHFGYELTQRQRGGLWPLWGMQSIDDRLHQLIADWEPETLILNGDIVDSRISETQSMDWLAELSDRVQHLVLVRGNHDRGKIVNDFEWVPFFETEQFFFHHGHLRPTVSSGKIEVQGHLHPSLRISDGAGLNLRLPAFVMEENRKAAIENSAEFSPEAPCLSRWILPAFSPWAGGVSLDQIRADDTVSRQWICSPQRVFEK